MARAPWALGFVGLAAIVVVYVFSRSKAPIAVRETTIGEHPTVRYEEQTSVFKLVGGRLRSVTKTTAVGVIQPSGEQPKWKARVRIDAAP